jgi:Uma2 family endonuclease
MTIDSVPPLSPSALPPLPRAPTREAWDAMTPDERAAAVEALPLCLPQSHIIQRAMAEGDEHLETRYQARDTLRRWYRSRERQVYVGSEMMVYYPGEEPITPDVFAVREVPTHWRKTWVVAEEGKGVEWALEVLASGRRAKDLDRNVARYAELGIAEYFVFDLRTRRLHAWRQAAPGVRRYEPMRKAGDAYASEVLGLDLLVVGRTLRFRQGTSELLTADDLLERLEETVAELAVHVEEQSLRAERERAAREEERAAREQERAAREAAEAEVAALRAELEKLRGR